MTFDPAAPATANSSAGFAVGDARAEPASRRWAPAAILLAMVVYLANAPFAVSHLDFTRDVGIAYGIANGERWPLQGPVLNWNLHLGPSGTTCLRCCFASGTRGSSSR